MSRRVLLRKVVLSDCGVSDPDACAFITATGITDTTIRAAIDALVIGMKADGSWAQSFAIYPMVGGTAFTHKFNLKNPLDTDAAYRLVFNNGGTGSWVHTSDGAKPDPPVGSWANTFLNASTVLDVNSHGLTLAYNSTSAHAGSSMGCYSSATVNLRILSRSNLTGANLDNAFAGANVGDGTAEGVVTGVKTSSTAHKTIKNGAVAASGAGGGSLPNQTIGLAHQNGNAGSGSYDDKRFCFASIHTGMTDGEIINLQSRIDTFNTSLSRKTW